jgi:predicted metal-dependent hydrolase
MDDRTPAESARFWRLNTLSAYKGVILDEKTAIDPDDLAAIKATKAEKERLIERENAVKSRFTRICKNKPTP